MLIFKDQLFDKYCSCCYYNIQSFLFLSSQTKLGHSDPDVTAAVSDQAAQLIHSSNLYRNAHAGHLADSLVSLLRRDRAAEVAVTGLEGISEADADKETDEAREWWKDGETKVFFCNSGTEANEAALKFSRKFARYRLAGSNGSGGGGGNVDGQVPYRVLSFQRGFHGRTMFALSATPSEKYQAPFAPLVPGFVTAEYDNIEALERIDWSESKCFHD